MKHHYLLAIAAIAATISVSAARPAERFLHHQATKTENTVKKNKFLKSKSRSEAALWRAGKETIIEWVEGEWLPSGVNTLTYDSRGNILINISESEEGFYRETFTYDDNNQVLTDISESSGDGVEFNNYLKTTRTYDPVVQSLITANYQYMWINSEWNQLGNNYTFTVTRNDKGNVTALERAVLYQDIFEPTERIFIEYGEDGVATSISTKNLGYDDEWNLVWIEGDKITDIVWENTNGQIVTGELLSFLTGANRIKSATVLSESETVNIKVEYTDELGSFKSEISGEDEYGTFHIVSQKDVIDSYGSYNATENYHAIFPPEEEGMEPETETIDIVENITYDAYGLNRLTFHSESYNGEEPEIYEWTEGIVNYDETHGYPLDYLIKTWDDETQELVNMLYVEYSDYADVAGIADVEAADTDAPAMYYNLQGVRVDDPTPGLYIRRQGNKATKVVVK